jgi:hypothetical protein
VWEKECGLHQRRPKESTAQPKRCFSCFVEFCSSKKTTPFTQPDIASQDFRPMKNSRKRPMGLSQSLATFLGPFRFLQVAFWHIAIFVAAYWLAFLLRFDFNVPVEFWQVFLATLPMVLAVKVPVFFATSHFHSWSRHIAFSDLVSLLGSAICSLVCLSVANQFAEVYFIPRAVLVLDCAGTILILGSLRSSWRLLQEHAWPIVRRPHRSRALLVGAELADKIFAQRLQTHASFPFQIRGFLDRDAKHLGRYIGGDRKSVV